MAPIDHETADCWMDVDAVEERLHSLGNDASEQHIVYPVSPPRPHSRDGEVVDRIHDQDENRQPKPAVRYDMIDHDEKEAFRYFSRALGA